MSALPAPVPVTLPASVSIRPFEPADAALLDELLRGMSERSRYQRYHGPKPRLTAGERAYFAGTDGRDHLAVVALAPGGAPLGIARSVRLREEPATAEVATEVIDAWQGQGLGTTLLARLARLAVTVGVERFTAVVLAQTGLVRALTRRGWWIAGGDGLTVRLQIDVWALLRGNSRAV